MQKNRSQILGSISLALLLLIAGALSARQWLRARPSSERSLNEPLYLPKARYVKLTTLGYNNLAGDILWFNTINYFGREFLGDQDFRWLTEMCELVTKLDQRSIHVFEFCGTLLSWIAKDPVRSNRVLTLAIGQHPSLWRFRYLRGFNYWYFLDEKEKAKIDFTKASKLPGAPPFLASLASRLMVDTESPEVAIEFLKRMLKDANNESVRSALMDKLNRAIISRDKRKLTQLVERYENRTGRQLESLDELVNAKLLRFVPRDPFGGIYSFDPENREITTSSGESGLEFFGKTASTGALKHEF